MLPGKTYKPEDFLRITWRRKWLIALPFVVVTSGTFIYTKTLPDRYQSATVIQVVPQRVPQNYVRSTVTAPLQERLQAIRQQILSRPRLEAIINEFNLYPNERRTMVMEDVIERMGTDINTSIGRGAGGRRSDPSSFTVSYQSTDPRLAMRVTERLGSLFISENLQNREGLADQTSTFLQSQLEEARRKLVEHDKKLQDFRQSRMGELPSQLQSNLQLMQAKQVELQGLVDRTNRDRDRQLVIDRTIADLTALPPAAPTRPARPTGGDANASRPASDELVAARTALQTLQLRLKADHPDVIRQKRMIKELEDKADAEALNTPLSPEVAPASAPSTAELNQQRHLLELQAERESLQRRIDAATAEQAQRQQQIADYQRKVEATPARESELVALQRDYETLQDTYKKLLTKAQDSKIAVELERRQIGEQFSILDPARTPERPTRPDRLRLTGVGAAAGLGLGLFLVAFLEYRDSSLRTHDDVVTSLALPVLALVPDIITPGELRARRRWRLVAVVATATSAIVVATAAAVWQFGLLDRWFR